MNRRSFLAHCLLGAVAATQRWLPMPAVPSGQIAFSRYRWTDPVDINCWRARSVVKVRPGIPDFDDIPAMRAYLQAMQERRATM